MGSPAEHGCDDLDRQLGLIDGDGSGGDPQEKDTGFSAFVRIGSNGGDFEDDVDD